jgi:hypothetical protein
MTTTPSIEHNEHLIDETQASFLNELVSGLTAVRNDAALLRTIDQWKARVRDSGFDPEALIQLFQRVRADRNEIPRDCPWVHVDKRELVLASIDVFTRHGSS